MLKLTSVKGVTDLGGLPIASVYLWQGGYWWDLTAEYNFIMHVNTCTTYVMWFLPGMWDYVSIGNVFKEIILPYME